MSLCPVGADGRVMAPGGHTDVLGCRRALAGGDNRSGIAGVATLSRAVVEPGLAYLSRGAAELLRLSGPVVEPRSGHVSGGRGRYPEATPCPSRRGHLARVLTHRGVRRRPPQSVGCQAAQDERDAADDDAERAKTLGAVPDPADADLVPLLHCASGLRVSRCQRVDPIPSAVGRQATTRHVNGADHREDGCGGSRRSRPGGSRVDTDTPRGYCPTRIHCMRTHPVRSPARPAARGSSPPRRAQGRSSRPRRSAGSSARARPARAGSTWRAGSRAAAR